MSATGIDVAWDIATDTLALELLRHLRQPYGDAVKVGAHMLARQVLRMAVAGTQSDLALVGARLGQPQVAKLLAVLPQTLASGLGPRVTAERLRAIAEDGLPAALTPIHF
jgi:hypothetical protein